MYHQYVIKGLCPPTRACFSLQLLKHIISHIKVFFPLWHRSALPNSAGSERYLILDPSFCFTIWGIKSIVRAVQEWTNLKHGLCLWCCCWNFGFISPPQKLNYHTGVWQALLKRGPWETHAEIDARRAAGIGPLMRSALSRTLNTSKSDFTNSSLQVFCSICSFLLLH